MREKRKRIVGLSIGSRAITVAQIYRTASGAIAIDRLGVSSIPPGTVGKGVILDADAVSRAIQDLLAASNVRSKEVALAIPGNGIVMRLITLPSMPENEMLEVLKGEVGDYAILAGEEPVLDFQILGRKVEGIEQKAEVLVMAAPTDLLSSYKAVLKVANLRLLAIKTVSLAILQVLSDGQLSSQLHEPAMLVVIEESSGTIAAVRDGNIQFMHNFEIRSDGSTEDGDIIEGLADELRSSLSYYGTAFPQEKRIDEIILLIDRADDDRICERLSGCLDMSVSNPQALGATGDHIRYQVANYSRICEKLSGYLGMPVSSPQALEAAGDHIQDQIANYCLSAYAATGAAAHVAADDKHVSMDLLRSQKLEAASVRNKVSMFLLCLLSMVLLSICGNLLLNARANSTMRRVISVQKENSDGRLLKGIPNIEADAARLETQVDVIRAVIDSTKRVSWAELLREISLIMPRTMWLTDLSWEEGDDAAFEGAAISYDSVLKFRDMLIDSLYFDSVKLISTGIGETGNGSLVQFEISCRIRREQGVREQPLGISE